MDCSRVRARSSVVVIVAVLALTVTACGDSGDENATAGNGSGQSADTGGALQTGSDEERIRATLEAVRDDYNSARPEEFCAHFTAVGRDWFIQSTGLPADKVDCERIVVLAERYRRKAPQTVADFKKMRKIRADIAGDEALVLTVGGLVGNLSRTLAMVERDGRWLIEGTDQTVERGFAGK